MVMHLLFNIIYICIILHHEESVVGRYLWGDQIRGIVASYPRSNIEGVYLRIFDFRTGTSKNVFDEERSMFTGHENGLP